MGQSIPITCSSVTSTILIVVLAELSGDRWRCSGSVLASSSASSAGAMVMLSQPASSRISPALRKDAAMTMVLKPCVL